MTQPMDCQSNYNTLKRIITRSQGSFSLTLIRCNDSVLRSVALKEIEQELPDKCTTLTINPNTQSLHQSIVTCIQEREPKILTVIGLESVAELDKLFAGVNWQRDLLKRDVSCPLMLWVTDTVLYKFNRNAPDLRTWAPPPISFLTN